MNKKMSIPALMLALAGTVEARFWHDMSNHWGLGGRLAAASTFGCYQAHNPATGETVSTQPGGASAQGGIFFEYARKNSCWSFGFLADINGDSFTKTFFSSTDTIGVPNHVSRLKTPLHAGVDLRAGGFVIERGLWYGLLGVEGVRNQLSLSSDTDVQTRGIKQGCTDFNFTKAGVRVGTGFEFTFREHGVVKFEYRFVANGKCLFPLTQKSPVSVWNHSINTRQQSFAVMLEYLF